MGSATSETGHFASLDAEGTTADFAFNDDGMGIVGNQSRITVLCRHCCQGTPCT